MSCNFKITFAGSVTEHIKTAKKAIEKHGGYLDLEKNRGVFELHVGIGKISGEFTITGNDVAFEIHKKPFIITCSRIEKELRNYAGG